MSSKKVLLHNQRTGGISRIMNLGSEFDIDLNGTLKTQPSQMRNVLNVSQGGGSTDAADLVDSSHAIINDGGILDLNEGQGLTNTGGEVFVNIGQGISFDNSDAIQSLPLGFLVAANDAPQRARDLADYICDGTDDQVEINQAINDSSGLVVLSSGTFDISDSIFLDSDNLTVRGQGNSTTIQTTLTGGESDFNYFEISGDDCHLLNLSTNVAVGNLLGPTPTIFCFSITGNSNILNHLTSKNDITSLTNGITNSGTHNQLSNIVIQDSNGAVEFEDGCNFTQMSQVSIVKASTGINIDDGSHTLTDFYVEASFDCLTVLGSKKVNLSISNFIFDPDSGVSVNIENTNSSHLKITNCQFTNSASGSGHVTVNNTGQDSHVQFENCSFDYDNSNSIVDVSDGRNWSFNNCFFENQTSTTNGLTFQLDSSNNYCFFKNCHVKGDFSSEAIRFQDNGNSGDGEPHAIVQSCFIENQDDSASTFAIVLDSNMGTSLIVDNILLPNNKVDDASLNATVDRNIS